MAKETVDKLNDIYDTILGAGDPLETDAVETTDDEPGQAPGDAAYLPEDYADEEGGDPRDGDPTEDMDDGDEPTDDSDEPTDDSGQATDADEGEPIDERLVNAGRRNGLDDETIIELAETRPQVLEALARAEDVAQRTAEDAVRKTPTQEPDAPAANKPLTFEDLGLDDDELDDMSPKAKQAFKALTAQMNKLSDAVSQQSQGLGQIQQTAQRDAVQKIDRFFDGVGKEVPILGASGQLTQKQADARLYAYRIARGAQAAFGGSLSDEEALTIGVNALKGSLSESQLKAKMVSDLNRNKKRFTSRYRGNRRGEAPKSAEDRALAEIDRVLNDPKYGT